VTLKCKLEVTEGHSNWTNRKKYGAVSYSPSIVTSVVR